MNIKQLFADEDAVSPVIGVILMVAITVILAAVIGTFVLGLGDQVQSTAPSASFTFDMDTSQSATAASSDISDDNSPDDGELTITHDGGDSITASQVEVTASPGGTAVGGTDIFTSSSEITAGSSDSVGVDTDATVRVVWSSESGDNSATLGKFEGPDA